MAHSKAHIRSQRKFIIPSIDHDGTVVDDDHCKAELFNSFFLEQSKIDSIPEEIPESDFGTAEGLNYIEINECEVLDVLKSPDTTKAMGPDGISPRLLKEAAPSIHKPLTKLFNLCLSQSKFPTE